eukprot:s200_g38.t1
MAVPLGIRRWLQQWAVAALVICLLQMPGLRAPCWVPGGATRVAALSNARRLPQQGRISRVLQRALEEDAGRRDVLADWGQSFLQTAGTVVAAFAAFYTGAKVAVINQPRRPELQGPFRAVGSRVVRLAGLRCRLLYPAAPSDGADAMARLVFFPGFLLEHLGTATSGCWEDAPAAPASDGSHPILVYSHGQGGNMDMGTYFLRQIASYGLIVLSVEHQDGSASTGDSSNPRPFSLTAKQLGVRYRALELVQVTQALLAEGLADELQGDKKNILVGGHSYGGPTAILAANAAPELFSALVLHDPAVGSEMPSLTQPVFAIVGDEYAGISNLVSVVRKVSGASGETRPWAGAWHFQGISHGNFVDAPLWECEMFDQVYGIGIIEGDILCAEKTAEHAVEGAPVSNSFTLQQRHVFRDKNEAGMQCDIIEEGEDRLEVQMDFEESIRLLRIADGWMAPGDTKSGEALRFFQVASSLYGSYCNDDASVRFTLPSLGEFTLAQRRMVMQGRSTGSTGGLEDGFELQGVITSTIDLDAMRTEKSEKAITAKFDLACGEVLLNVAGLPEPLHLHRIPEDRDPMQYVRDVFAHLNLQAPLFIMRLLRLLLIPAAGPYDPAEAHNAMARSAADFARGPRRATEGDPPWQRLPRRHQTGGTCCVRVMATCMAPPWPSQRRGGCSERHSALARMRERFEMKRKSSFSLLDASVRHKTHSSGGPDNHMERLHQLMETYEPRPRS